MYGGAQPWATRCLLRPASSLDALYVSSSKNSKKPNLVESRCPPSWCVFPLMCDKRARYAKVDRRPLDPPPIILLRLLESEEGERPFERELSYE